MRKVLIILASLLLLFPAHGLAQKRGKTQPKKRAVTADKPITTPCGVYYHNTDEFISELFDPKWRKVGRSNKETFYYSAQDIICDKETGILKVWVKAVPDPEKQADYTHALVRYEFKCPKYQLRITGYAEYNADGTTGDSRTHRDAQWDELFPDSIGEVIFNRACRYRTD